VANVILRFSCVSDPCTVMTVILHLALFFPLIL